MGLSQAYRCSSSIVVGEATEGLVVNFFKCTTFNNLLESSHTDTGEEEAVGSDRHSCLVEEEDHSVVYKS
jgi:hypothetical protein